TRYLRATVHHAATGRAAGGKRLVGAHRAHIDRAILGPTEQPRIERKFPIEVVSIKLVPADVARGHRRDHRSLTFAVGLEEQERRATRIGHDRKPADARYILGVALNRTAGLPDARRIAVHGIDRYIAGPARLCPRHAHRLRDSHEAGHHDRPLAEHRVGAVLHR